MDRQVLAASESFKRCLDGLVTIGSPQQQKSQYQADMAQVNAENMVEMRQLWIQVNKGPEAIGTENPFPFNDNLTTLMLIVESDLNEVQRERLTSSLSLLKMNCSVRRKAQWRILHSA